MGIDVGRRRHIGMPQPVLNHFHGDVVCQQERGTAIKCTLCQGRNGFSARSEGNRG